MSDEKVKVEQIDREAAASYNAWLLHMPSDSAHICRIREGKCGDGLAEAFAKHRTEWRNGLAAAIDSELAASKGGTIVIHVHPDPVGGWSVFNERASAKMLPTIGDVERPSDDSLDLLREIHAAMAEVMELRRLSKMQWEQKKAAAAIAVWRKVEQFIRAREVQK